MAGRMAIKNSIDTASRLKIKKYMLFHFFPTQNMADQERPPYMRFLEEIMDALIFGLAEITLVIKIFLKNMTLKFFVKKMKKN